MTTPTIGDSNSYGNRERLLAWQKTGHDLSVGVQGVLTQIGELEARLHGAYGRISAADRRECTQRLDETYKEYHVAREGYVAHLIDPHIYPLLLPSNYHLMRVLAVLTASEDPAESNQDLGHVVNGQVVPAEPWLRNPAIHMHPADNYIVAWIRLANWQLLSSGAHFGLDVESLKYVLERNTPLHRRECWDGAAEAAATVDFLNQRMADPDPNNPYYHSVILIFRWGKDMYHPAGQACSGGTSPCVLMSGYYDHDPIYLDGRLTQVGQNQLSHEFGHFMGLSHPHPSLADTLGRVASLNGRNPHNWPLVEANLGQMPGATAADLQQARQQALDLIATWPYSLEQDCWGDPNAGIPYEYAITDTPIDLGMGLALTQGDAACSGSHDYTFTRFAGDDLQEKRDSNGNFIWWEVKPGIVPHTFQDAACINDQVRNNIMSYWRCHVEAQRYSPDQVKRMHFVLENHRKALVSRVLNPTIEIPDLHQWVEAVVMPPKPWPPDYLRRYFEDLARREIWRKPVPTPPWPSCGVSDRVRVGIHG